MCAYIRYKHMYLYMICSLCCILPMTDELDYDIHFKYTYTNIYIYIYIYIYISVSSMYLVLHPAHGKRG